MQPAIEHLAPLHGMVQPPVFVQSKSQVEPGLQVVVQLPPVSEQTLEQVVFAAHSVLHPPLAQVTEQGWVGEVQAKLQVPASFGSALAAHAQLEPEQEHLFLDIVGSGVQLTPIPVTTTVPP
jgi:hypothetical protein